MALKPGPKRTATSTGKPDQRQRDKKNLAISHHYNHQNQQH
jgi:hypothetical protein